MSTSVERVDLAEASRPWKEEHLARYVFADRQLGEGLVLDVACGTGEGSAYLGRAHGRRLLSVDLDLPAVRRAAAVLRSAGVDGVGLVASAVHLPFPHACMDAVVSFETVEHLDDPAAFLAEIRRVLRPGGLLHMSTPNALATSPGGGPPENPFHVREFTPDELEGILPPGLELEFHGGQHLPPGYGPAPFLPSFRPDELTAWARVRFRVWQLLLRLPWIRDPVFRALTGMNFHPLADEYTFLSDDLMMAHVQYIICRRTAGE